MITNALILTGLDSVPYARRIIPSVGLPTIAQVSFNNILEVVTRTPVDGPPQKLKQTNYKGFDHILILYLQTQAATTLSEVTSLSPGHAGKNWPPNYSFFFFFYFFRENIYFRSLHGLL